MLEQPKKTGSKVVSHVLASHGGGWDSFSVVSFPLGDDSPCVLGSFSWTGFSVMARQFSVVPFPQVIYSSTRCPCPAPPWKTPRPSARAVAAESLTTGSR